MNRRGFFKATGLGLAAGVVAVPKLGDAVGSAIEALAAGKPVSRSDAETARLELNKWQGDQIYQLQKRPEDVFSQLDHPVYVAAKNTNQSLDNGVETRVTYPLVEAQTTFGSGIVTPNSSADTFQVGEPGLYWVHAFLRFATNSSGYRNLTLDDSTVATVTSRASVAGQAGAAVSLQVAALLFLAAGDSFWILAQQNSGAALNCDGGRLSVIRIVGLKAAGPTA